MLIWVEDNLSVLLTHPALPTSYLPTLPLTGVTETRLL